MQTAFVAVRADVEAHLDRFEVNSFPEQATLGAWTLTRPRPFSQSEPDQDKLPVMLSLLDRIGQWISSWQAPVSDMWQSVKSSRYEFTRAYRSDCSLSRAPRSNSKLSSFRKAFLAGLYGALPPRFVPAFQVFVRQLLTFDAPSTAFKPEYPRAMSTLVTILDRYDPVLFALVYEEIEAKVQRDCRGRFQEKKLDSLLIWLNGSGVGAGTSGGVMGWVSGLYANSEKRGSGDDARKFLKPTFSRFEYHIHKILCQLRYVRGLFCPSQPPQPDQP